MELRHLRYFVAVAEELHFGRAASRLNMSQPPLSQQIKQLERELGVELFRRSRRRVELTEAGEVFLAKARTALVVVEEASDAARRAGRGELGKLAVGFVGSAAHSILPEILKVFRERSPGVELTLEELTSAQQVAALGEGRIQVGFVRPPVRGEDLELKTVLEEPFLVALPEDHGLCSQSSIRLVELAQEPFVAFPRNLGAGFYDQIVGACRDAGFSPKIVQEAIQMQTIVGMVAAGIGVALVPASLQNFTRRGVAYREIYGDVPQVPLAVVWERGEEQSSAVLSGFLAVVDEMRG